MKIEYTPESLRDLQKIREIIIDRFMDEKIALKVQKDITQSIRKLEIFPNMGEDLSETVKAGEGYRFLFCRKNYIFYRIEGDTVRIVRILNEKREFVRILFGIYRGIEYWNYRLETGRDACLFLCLGGRDDME